MSTNFYVVPPGSEAVHLGKSAIGWGFTFRAYPAAAPAPEAVTWVVDDYASWLRLLDLGEVRDEYGHVMARRDLLNLIGAKRGYKNDLHPELGDYLDAGGCRFVPGEFC